MRIISIEEANRFVKYIEKSIGDKDDERIVDILVAIEDLKMNSSILKATSLARLVGKLRKSTDSRVSTISARLVASWKKCSEVPETGKNTNPIEANNSRSPSTSLKLNLREYLGMTLDLPNFSTIEYVYRSSCKLDETRVKCLNTGNSSKEGPVVYWMSRDQRISDNWALIRAQNLAIAKATTLAIVFCLAPKYLEGCIRQRGFMLRGLKMIEEDAAKLNIPFILLLGLPKDTFPLFLETNNISTIVADFSPLRISQQWKNDVIESSPDVRFEVVDAHNIAPCWVVSQKCEFSAKTIRPKIHGAVDTYLTEFPSLTTHPHQWPADYPRCGVTGPEKWLAALDSMTIDFSIPELDWCEPGERAAYAALKSFFSRLNAFSDDRNNPCLRTGVSNLSPYFRFGHLSVQRAILEIRRSLNVSNKALFTMNRTTGVHAFCEEAVVRRELSDNFCYYNAQYDSIDGAHR